MSRDGHQSRHLNQGTALRLSAGATVAVDEPKRQTPSPRGGCGQVSWLWYFGVQKKHGYWSRFQIRYLFHGTSWFSEELCRRCFGDLMKCLHDWSFLAPALFYILYLNLFPPHWFTECSLSSVGQVSPVFRHICSISPDISDVCWFLHESINMTDGGDGSDPQG